MKAERELNELFAPGRPASARNACRLPRAASPGALRGVRVNQLKIDTYIDPAIVRDKLPQLVVFG
jgi:hypothetical protein